ncbi:hypothetical protein CEXT_139231 [Caerostris extrusa]|uniref:Uncharacterized protein n=1 Tax=Caerostris extrusa TaxID=172846 RepID=A0AAV4Q323_CAEEX|nr:hypothetical protein CEXT_139231 [Caerostris extrusa]
MSNLELRTNSMKATVKHDGQSVMAWGWVLAVGSGILEFIDGRLDQNVYLGILITNLPQHVQKLFSTTSECCQDKSSKHKAHRGCFWLLCNCPQVMET